MRRLVWVCVGAHVIGYCFPFAYHILKEFSGIDKTLYWMTYLYFKYHKWYFRAKKQAICLVWKKWNYATAGDSTLFLLHLSRDMQKRVFGHMRQQRPRSACASAQSDQRLSCPQTESLNTIEWFIWEQRPGWDFAHVQDGVNPHIFARRFVFAWRDPFICTSFDYLLLTPLVWFCDVYAN